MLLQRKIRQRLFCHLSVIQNGVTAHIGFLKGYIYQGSVTNEVGLKATIVHNGLFIFTHMIREAIHNIMRCVEWAQNEIAVVPNFHKRILFRDEAHFWLNGYVNKQNCRIWSEANPQVYVETPLHPEKLTVGCALWAGGIFLQKR
ncbi:hypothetical protein TNCV_5024351 [Trichonephila clavipes]|nr:hypothetical protein TNCV_5024351 [Trichonephila clavipes]